MPNDSNTTLQKSSARICVVGGGIIGLEMATVYAGLGSSVTVVELTADVVELSPDYRSVGEVLLAEASAINADLLIMGAFSHSRLRQLILGGVTKFVFEQSPLPVLMALDADQDGEISEAEIKGAVKALEDARTTAYGEHCRDIESKIETKEESRVEKKTVCRQKNGIWQVAG